MCYANLLTLQVPHPAFLWPAESLLTSSFRQSSGFNPSILSACLCP